VGQSTKGVRSVLDCRRRQIGVAHEPHPCEGALAIRTRRRGSRESLVVVHADMTIGVAKSFTSAATGVRPFELGPTDTGVRIRHEIEVSGDPAGFTRLTIEPFYRRSRRRLAAVGGGWADESVQTRRLRAAAKDRGHDHSQGDRPWSVQTGLVYQYVIR
jgi:hypothetical protein